MIHWSSGREGHNNYRRDLVIWLVHLIYSAVGFALCYNYVILNYCIRFAVLPCVRLFLWRCLPSCRIVVKCLFTNGCVCLLVDLLTCFRRVPCSTSAGRDT